MNILETADKIVNERTEEKDRMYGDFGESMDRTRDLFNLMSKETKLTSEDVYKVLIALKLSREAFSHKEDNLLDAVAYIGALNNYINENITSYQICQ